MRQSGRQWYAADGRWNNGTGLWSDAGASGNVYEANRSYGNIGEGLRYEDSHAGTIIKNLIGPDARPDNVQCVAAHVPKLLDGVDACTGFQAGTASDRCYDVEIAIVNSDGTVVGSAQARNKLTTYCGGIIINVGTVGASVNNDKIIYNDITFHGPGGHSDPLGGTNADRLVTSAMFSAAPPNYFDYNRYFVDVPAVQAVKHWRWLRGSSLARLDWNAWRALGMDTHGSLGSGGFPTAVRSGPSHHGGAAAGFE
jgi:hypothetical protein